MYIGPWQCVQITDCAHRSALEQPCISVVDDWYITPFACLQLRVVRRSQKTIHTSLQPWHKEGGGGENIHVIHK